MLTRLHVKGFKSLLDLTIEFPRLTVLFGPNASGKSNILEAAQMLSRSATARTLSDAFDESIRGYPMEAFAFPEGGLPALLRQPAAALELEATVQVGADRYGYRVVNQVHPSSGSLSVQDERLVKLTKGDRPVGNPMIGRVEDCLRVRKKGQAARPREEPVGLNRTLLADARFSGKGYEAFDTCRGEFEAWRVYYLDPRVAMRVAHPPADVRDIGVLGEDIAAFLYRLRAENRKRFDAVKRILRSVIPSVDDMSVDLDEKRGTLDVQIAQGGCSYSSRIISEGTLRVLALCSIAVNPWADGLVAFEEPENGVHPRRLELIAELLVSLAIESGRQVIVTTHSASFCAAVLRLARGHREDVAVMGVRSGHGGTTVETVSYADSLFQDEELVRALSSPTEDGLFEALLLRGLLDE